MDAHSVTTPIQRVASGYLTQKVRQADSAGPSKQDVWKRLSEKGFDNKDRDRIRDMIAKANGDNGKEYNLAKQMSNSITSYEKAYRRYAAAENDNYHDIAAIFKKRFDDLFAQGKR